MFCDVCGRETTFRVVYEKWTYPIAKCLACGLGRAQIHQSFDPDSIYEAGYFQGAMPDGYADYIGSESVLRTEFQHVLRHMERCDVRRGTLLEIGCAYGFFLAEARATFQRVSGIDVAQDAVTFCRSRGLDVECGDLDREFLEARGPFDAVVMLDVIEHLKNPAETLAAVVPYMSPEAVLLITTGDWESLCSRLMGRSWRLMTPPQHLSFFSRRSLRLLLDRLGFEVLECRYPWKRVPIGLLVYQLGRILGLSPRNVRLKNLGIPVNLFDAVRIVAVRKDRRDLTRA
jgi:SAM-dependent methyltransferase